MGEELQDARSSKRLVIEVGEDTTMSKIYDAAKEDGPGNRGHTPLSGSSVSSHEKKTLATRRMTTRRQTAIDYDIGNIPKDDEPTLKALKEEDDDKITAQDILVQATAFEEGDAKAAQIPTRLVRRESSPPVHHPVGGLHIKDNKYWVPKIINPLQIELMKYQAKDLKDAFDFVEDPKTGMAGKDDIATVVRACGFEPKPGEIEDIMDKIKPNFSGSLTFEEFCFIFQYKLDQTDPIQEIERAFKLMDTSKTGRVTLQDLKEVSAQAGYAVNDEELQEMIDEAYPGPDGEITMNGFVHFITKKHYFDDIKEKGKKDLKKLRRSYKPSQALLQMTG